MPGTRRQLHSLSPITSRVAATRVGSKPWPDYGQAAAARRTAGRIGNDLRDGGAILRGMMTWHDFVVQLLLILAPAAILTLIQLKKR